ncbi:lactonase family protein [Paenibacillus sp. MER TA 81-3]|uniref:lactonase family protein n=1 Tax=Paenibacillus sp. MER TA 81-3 TaxID=2939573 RepID=UPI002040347A|nr:lactonase family protein [Paenibacillus sp. MER TA 81-3]MCM3339800.1 lactonase family protein [Paenibacillus sp. MER TA 81-3]
MTERMLVFVGSYAEASDPGVYVYEFKEETGELTLQDQVSGLKNPTFLNVNVPDAKLYSIAEGQSEAGVKTGEAVCFSIDPAQAKLQELNRALAVDAPTCHIQRDADNRYLLVASYHGGRVGLVALQADGLIGEQLDVKQHEGHGPHPERQVQPHPHSVFFSPDNRYLFVSDLGIDCIRAYTIDKERNVLQWHGDTEVQPGAGPRHLTFHPNGELVYVINEVNSTITSFRYDAEAGRLHTIETVPTLPTDFIGDNSCAEITVSENGKYLYGSNRGHDSIVVYTIDSETGRLTLVEHVSTEGKHPRHFALTPGGRFLIAANRDTNNIAIFRVNEATGKLQYTGSSVQVSKPVCVKPVILAV